jgi:chromatin licensing and DNA replication factor 1
MSHSVSSCLPELVALIHHIFKSVNCLSITKEELVHKIIINSFDIVERSMYQWCPSSIGFDCI